MNQMLLAQWHLNTWILCSSGGYCLCLVPISLLQERMDEKPKWRERAQAVDWREGCKEERKASARKLALEGHSKLSLSHKWSSGGFSLWPLGYFIMRKLCCSEHQDLKLRNFTPFPADPAKHDAFCSMKI